METATRLPQPAADSQAETPFCIESFIEQISQAPVRPLPAAAGRQAIDYADDHGYSDWRSYCRSRRESRAAAQVRSTGLDSGRISHRAAALSFPSGAAGEPRTVKTTEVTAWGGMARIVETTRRQAPRKATGGGVRGAINGFSADAKKRMARTLGRVDLRDARQQSSKSRLASCVFLTLTYPAYFPADHTEAKRHLDTLTKRLQRRRWFAGLLWKYELQKRGAPHFHLLVFSRRRLRLGMSPRTADDHGAGLRGWFCRAWHEIVFPPDLPHRPDWMQLHSRFGTRTDAIYNPGGGKLSAYLNKYMSKEHDGHGHQQTDQPTGRCWGIRGNVPFTEAATFLLYGDAAEHILHRRIRRWGRKSRYLSKSTRNRRRQYVYGDGYAFTQLLRGLPWFFPGWNMGGTFSTGTGVQHEEWKYGNSGGASVVADNDVIRFSATHTAFGFASFSRRIGAGGKCPPVTGSVC